MPAVAMPPARTRPDRPDTVRSSTARSSTARTGTDRTGTAPEPAGRHRREETARSRAGRTFDVAGRVGSLVTLAAGLVLAGAAAGLVDGMAPGEAPTVTVTFDSSDR